MGLFKNPFGKKQPVDGSAAADRARATSRMAGQSEEQTADEQQATRSRMEAEMDAQRARRSQGPSPDA